MIEKKSVKGDLESKRKFYLVVGFVVVFALIYASFELFASSDKAEDVGMADEELITVMDETVLATDRTPPQAPPPAAAQQEIILKTIDNEIHVDVEIDFGQEFDKDMVIDEYVPVDVIDEEVDVSPPLRFIEEMPEYIGGADAMYEFLTKNLQYPPAAKEAGISGVVQVEFVVEKDGRISSVRPLVSVFQELDDEAVRVVKSMPKWKPGKQMGRAVRCFYQIPIRFSIQ